MLTIISGPYIAGESHSTCDKYVKEAKNAPQIHVLKTEELPTKSTRWELEDIVFTEANTRWVHHLHVDALVIIVRIANSNVHRLLVDNGSAVDIIYLDAYKRMRLTESELSPTTSLLYGFIRDNVIPKGMVKLAMTVGEHPRVWTIVAKFLMVDYSSVVNWIIGRPLLKALKAITLIYHLTMKFPTAEGTRQLHGN